MRALWAFALAGLGVAASLSAAQADITVTCPLPQATRTIVEPMPPGWSAQQDVSGLTNYRVDNSGGPERLICEYGAAGTVQYLVPPNQDCTRLPGRRFQCAVLPPPGPVVVSDGPITLSDNGVADLDAGGGQPDLKLRADNPFLRLIQPINGTQLSPQGTHKPSIDDCRSAPYSGAPIAQQQLPVGVWSCFTTGNGNIGHIRVSNIIGVPGLPVPMTIFFDHTTWSPSPGGPGGGPGGPGGPGGGFGGPPHQTGTLTVPQTYTFDLDEGQISGSSGDADFWFQAVTLSQMFIKPMNGAQIAVGDRSNRGRRGCRHEIFSSVPVPLNTLAVGDYVCATTNLGRISQFHIDAISPGVPKTLTLSYATWD